MSYGELVITIEDVNCVVLKKIRIPTVELPRNANAAHLLKLKARLELITPMAIVELPAWPPDLYPSQGYPWGAKADGSARLPAPGP